jgi:RHS repeat-associated protein
VPRTRGGKSRKPAYTDAHTRHMARIVLAVTVLLVIVVAGFGLGSHDARGDEGAPTSEAIAELPTAEQTKEALESEGIHQFGVEPAETEPKAAEELPHRELDRGEALELAEGVFGAQLESPAGIFDELEPEKFLSDDAAVVPVSSLPGSAEGEEEPASGEPQGANRDGRSVLLESTLPLRTENSEGKEEVVDLSLQSPQGSGGELQPQNPLTEVSIPAHLGEGISLAGGIQIELARTAGDGAPGDVGEDAPTNVEERYAFYPNVAEDTDLVVAPTPSGVETMTDIRSAEAPQSTTYRLSLPDGATLRSSKDGGAEVVEDGKATLVVPPPTATDAEGYPVPLVTKVEGDELTVGLSAEADPTYPVLVDPWYEIETYCLTFCGSSFAGWSGSTDVASYQPLPFSQWDPSHYPGLDLTSGYPGPAWSGNHADWSYWVPRYSSDIEKYGSPPTTWVTYMVAEGVLFLPFGNTANYPAMVLGLVEPGTGWAPGDWVHYGGQGELPNWGNVGLENPPNNQAVKGADLNLVTYEYEAEAKFRDVFLGGASVYVADVDAPRILELQAPSGWVTGASAGIRYGFEDTGLGVRSAGIRIPGEAGYHAGWGADFTCTGTSVSPCPRRIYSTEAKAPGLGFIPNELPTGEDQLEVTVGDPFWEPGHVATGTVTVKVDHTAPEITLSGSLSEQEGQGTLTGEYPLEVSVADGSNEVPQSGVAKVELKVDGKKKTMPNEAAWNPGCKTQNCSVTGGWTLKASEYTAGTHLVEVLATDALGNVSRSVIEVETGLEPIQTGFTSPHPTYDDHKEVSKVTFAASREGKPVEGATFRCSFDGKAATACSSPYVLPKRLEEGKWQTLSVAAKEKSGAEDPTPAVWRFETGIYPPVPAPSGENLVFPEEGKKTASYFTLEAGWGPKGASAEEDATGVTFQMKLPGQGDFEDVPTGCAISSKGGPVSWPMPIKVRPDRSPPVYLKVRGCPAFVEAGYPEKEIQFRAVFDGGAKAAGATAAVNTEFVYKGNQARVATDATESVGPGSVDLLTGGFTMSATDVSIPVPGYETNLEFTRSYSSTMESSIPASKTILGSAWQPSLPLESESEGEAWTSIQEEIIEPTPEVTADECWEEDEDLPEGYRTITCSNTEHCTVVECEEWVEEEAQPEERWLELVDTEGSTVPVEMVGGIGGSLVLPEWADEMKLRWEGAERIVLSYPNGSHTVFRQEAATPGHRTFVPREFSYQATPSSDRMVYVAGHEANQLLLTREIAPTPAGVAECGDETAKYTPGCRTLEFEYTRVNYEKTENPFHWLATRNALKRISYYDASGSGAGQVVAQYEYNGNYELTEEWDPRLSEPKMPALKTKYTYQPGSNPATDQLISLTPPGQEPWTFRWWEHKGEEGATEEPLESVSRGGATTTIAYGVPVSGSGAPYNMSASEIARWGQSDLPVDATAIFPPTHTPTSYPPSTYTGATIDYLDPDGSLVNSASPSPPGVEGSSISTTETNQKGDVIRELSAQNRLVALQASNTVARSHELDSHSVYNAEGTEMLESWGPLHEVRLQSGEKVPARRHTTTYYDEREPPPPAGMPPAYMPTKEIVGGLVPGREAEIEPQVTETRYEWTHRLPEETIVDPGGLAIRSVTEYNALGQVIETRQPEGAAGGTAGDMRTIYWSATGSGECQGTPAYANLPCRVTPAKQASGTGRPELLTRKFDAYNGLAEPTEVVEASNEKSENRRRTVTTYDTAGRQLKTKIEGGGTAITKSGTVETQYSPTTGAATKQQFICEKECTGFDSQATTTTYNALGEVTGYEDADGNKTETKYDAYGRPVSVTDAKETTHPWTQTLHYDETSGVLTSLEVSGVGTFTAAYDADGDLIRRGLPNGLTASTAYNTAGEPTKLAYTKTSSCGESCTWYEETLERSIYGQILADEGTLVKNHYTYDKDGRLTEAQETPTKGQCTSREYKYDADSNRLRKTTTPGVGGACATSGGITQSYKYDEADRLEGPTYDPWGRITILPAEFAGGKELKTSYFSNDMVATQSQGLITNTFQLDATGRQRQREQAGGVAGLEVLHYDGPGDSPSWSALGSTWSRDISGIGGELAAIQESTGSTTFKLTDLHGDVVASASSNPTATKLLATYRSDEFGEPVGSSAGRFSWLGGKSRRTELSSGVIQMGARSYIPSLGRFLTPDPIPGGSANPYDYADQDPINNFDLGGEACHDVHGHHDCRSKAARRELHRALVRAKRQTKHLEKAHHFTVRCATSLCDVSGTHPGGGVGPSPGELAESAVKFVANHVPQIYGSTVIGGLSGYLIGKYGATEEAQSCEKSAEEAWAETAELAASGPVGFAISIGDVAANCAASAASP